MVARRLVVLLALGGGLAGCGGEDREPAPRAEEAQPPRMPASVTAACATIAAGSEVPVLCPPPGGSGGPLEIAHFDLDPTPCAYLVNLEAPLAAREGPGPSQASFGGTCERLPVDTPPGRAWPADPPLSLRLVANPPLESGREPRVTRPSVLRRLAVRGEPGLLLQSLPFPEGGFSGGRYALVWREGGASYALSVRWASGDRARPPSDRQVAMLLGLASAMEPAAG